MEKFNEIQFQNCIKKCNKNINKAFKIYLNLTDGIFSWKNFIDYQNILIETLYEIKKQEFPLKKILKKVRNGTDNINDEKLLSIKIEELESIENSIKIFGDFLCWIFYMNSLSLIDKHLEKPQIGMNSIGSGIVAEIEAIKRLNTPDNPQFYLYNEISSFLRIGDLSVFDKESGKIIGFGEVKSSKPQDNNLDISIDFIVNKKNLYIPSNLIIKKNQKHNFLDENMIKHLNKQIQSMKDSLTNKKKFNKKIEQEVNIPHYKELQSLINKCNKNGFAIKKISNDILYLSIKNTLNDINFNEVFDKNHITNTLKQDPKKGQNNITISKLNLLSYGKNIPFLFFPISNRAKKRAFNQTIFIIFNYNTIIDYYYKQGFIFIKKKKIPYLEKKLKKEIVSICLYTMHEIYINMFLDENSAIKIMNKMLTESSNGKGNRQIFMNMRHVEK